MRAEVARWREHLVEAAAEANEELMSKYLNGGELSVDEIRAVRKAHAAQFNNDLNAICADLKKQEKNCGHPVVSLPPKQLQGKN